MENDFNKGDVSDIKKPSLGVALLIVAFMFVVIIAQLIVEGSPDIHLTMVFSITFATILHGGIK